MNTFRKGEKIFFFVVCPPPVNRGLAGVAPLLIGAQTSKRACFCRVAAKYPTSADWWSG